MKTLKSVACICAIGAMLAGCGNQLSKDHFFIDGSIDGVDNQYIYLSYHLGDSTQLDSILVSGGKFEFKGELKVPVVVASLYIGDRNNYSTVKGLGFLMEPVVMTVQIDTADFANPVITGSFAEAQNDSVEADVKKIMADAQPILDAIKAETDHDKAAAMREQMTPYYDRKDKAQKAFVRTHPDSYVSMYLLGGLASSMPYEELESIYDSLTDMVKTYGPYASEVKQELDAQARVQTGALATDFATVDVNGDSIRLSDFKGKYILLDFWATWCVPCRKSFPHVKELYDTYHPKGLEVVCIADNDKTPNDWRAAIKKDGIEKFHHVLRGMKVIDSKTFKLDQTNDISYKYAIHYLPTKYLICKDFTIIGKFTDEELDSKLKEIFGGE